MGEITRGTWDEAALPRPSRDPEALERDLRELGYCLIEAALEPPSLWAIRTRLGEQAAAERALHASKNPANPQERSQWVGMLLNKGGRSSSWCGTRSRRPWSSACSARTT